MFSEKKTARMDEKKQFIWHQYPHSKIITSYNLNHELLPKQSRVGLSSLKAQTINQNQTLHTLLGG